MEMKFKLICVGSPAGNQKELQRWFRKKQKITRKKLTIRRYRDHDKVIEMFREADLVVLPSRVEGFGLIALEAISAGIPVLVSSQTGISESLREVDGGCDLIVTPNKPEEWARRIYEFSSQTTQERHGKALRIRENYQQIYSWQEETEKFINLVKHVLGGGMWIPVTQPLLHLIQKFSQSVSIFVRVVTHCSHWFNFSMTMQTENY